LEVAVFRDFALPGAVLFALGIAAMFKPQFFDPFSLSLTLGGAIIVTGFSYSRNQLKALTTALRRLFAEPDNSLQSHISDLRRLTELFRLEGLKGLETQEKHLRDSFLKYGIELLVDLHNEESIRARLEHRLVTVLGEHEISRQILLTLGKLLPSFGLIGTLIGMVMLLGNISNEDPRSLPSALGLAVLTTLYGAVSANVFVAPLLARLQSAAVEREMKMRVTKDWVIMVARGATIDIANPFTVVRPAVETDRRRMQNWAPVGLPASR
jgi:chemotaxis protein MotA